MVTYTVHPGDATAARRIFFSRTVYYREVVASDLLV